MSSCKPRLRGHSAQRDICEPHTIVPQTTMTTLDADPPPTVWACGHRNAPEISVLGKQHPAGGRAATQRLCLLDCGSVPAFGPIWDSALHLAYLTRISKWAKLALKSSEHEVSL